MYLKSVATLFSYLKKHEGWTMLLAKSVTPLLYCMPGITRKNLKIGENCFEHGKLLDWMSEDAQEVLAMRFVDFQKRNGKRPHELTNHDEAEGGTDNHDDDEVEEEEDDNSLGKVDDDVDIIDTHDLQLKGHRLLNQRKGKGVVLVDEKQQEFVFASKLDAAKYLDCDSSRVSECLRDIRKSVRGYKALVVTPSNEYHSSTGTTSNKKRKITLLSDNKQGPMPSRTTTQNPVLRFRKPVSLQNDQGEIMKFSSLASAATYLGISYTSIWYHCSKGHNTVRNHTIIRQGEKTIVETNQGERKQFSKLAGDGGEVDDDDKEQEEEDDDDTVLLVDEKGKEFKFRNQKSAAQYLHCHPKTISNCLRGKQKTVKGHKVFQLPGYRSRPGKPVSLQNDQGEIMKFSSLASAATYLGISYKSIWYHCSKGHNTVRNHTIIRQGEKTIVETNQGERKQFSKLAGDGGEVDDDDKEQEEEEEEEEDDDDTVLLVDEKGKEFKFRNQKSAAQYLHCHPKTISNCLRGKQKTVKGHKVFQLPGYRSRPGKPVSLQNDQGEIMKFSSLASAATYLGISVDKFRYHYSKGEQTIQSSELTIVETKQGERKQFSNQKRAAEYLNTSQSNVSACVTGRSRSVKGHKVYQIAISEKQFQRVLFGPTCGNLDEVADNGGEVDDDDDDDDTVLLVDETGKEFKFRDKNSAAQYLQCHPKTISCCVRGKMKTVKGHKAFLLPGYISKLRKQPVNLQNVQGEIMKFSSLASAATYLGISANKFRYHYSKGEQTIQNHTVIWQSHTPTKQRFHEDHHDEEEDDGQDNDEEEDEEEGQNRHGHIEEEDEDDADGGSIESRARFKDDDDGDDEEDIYLD